VNDDWRLQIDPHAPARPEHVVERLEAAATGRAEARELGHDLSVEFRDKVIVSREEARLFLYAGTREQAEAARRLVERLAQEHGWTLDLELRRWHREAEDWEDPDEPLPAGPESRGAEHAALIEAERKHSAATGRPEFEVRADLRSRGEAARLAKRLNAEGLPAVHRWRYLLVGATDEDAAKELAERIRGEAPPDSHVYVEGTWQEALAEQPPNPFAFLGGLADT
jgi:hypothetical protein